MLKTSRILTLGDFANHLLDYPYGKTMTCWHLGWCTAAPVTTRKPACHRVYISSNREPTRQCLRETQEWILISIHSESVNFYFRVLLTKGLYIETCVPGFIYMIEISVVGLSPPELCFKIYRSVCNFHKSTWLINHLEVNERFQRLEQRLAGWECCCEEPFFLFV